VAELPSGTVTFLFTDLEGSTRLWEEHPEAMRPALARHDAILHEAIAVHGGFVVKTTGDGFHAVFGTAHDAVDAAVAAQLALIGEPWEMTGRLRVRMGLHTCEAELRDGDYYGSAVNRAARLMATAHGGQIVLSLATSELAREAPVELLELGEHRLPDLARPERVFQVVHKDLPIDFPALRSLDAFPSNLPLQLTVFVGREDELAEIAAALGWARVVTLTGIGGVGKTRAALQTAARMLAQYRDGAWFCELAPVRDPDAVVEAVASALGVVAGLGQTIEDTLLDFLRSKQILLVFDNCEHLLDSVTDLVDRVVRACPGVTVLATSREGLALTGERILALRSLGIPDLDATGDAATAADAVRLFVERASDARSGFALQDDNTAAIVQICRRLDGIPLAIELAAARVQAMSPQEIATRLDDQFRLLRGGTRGAVERHQTLRRTIDWSYDLLSDGERLVLDRLSVFAAGAVLDDAEAVVAGDTIAELDVVEHLSALVRRSLVLADETDGRTRYRLLETVRQYAHEHLEESGSAEAMQRRHAVHYAALAEEAGPALRGSEQLAWIERLGPEIGNLRAAQGWAIDHGELDLALAVIVPLCVSGTAIGYTALEWASTLAAEPDVDMRPLGPALLAAAAFHAVLGSYLERAAALEARRYDAEAALGMQDNLAGFRASTALDLFSERPVDCVNGARRWVELARSSGDRYEMVLGLTGIATGTGAAIGQRSAGSAARECVAEARQLANPSSLATALGVLGLHLVEVEPMQSIPLFEEAIQVGTTVGNQQAIRIAQAGLARGYDLLGNEQASLQAYLRAMNVPPGAGHRHSLIAAFIGIASMLASSGHDEDAALLLGAADSIFIPALAWFRETREQTLAALKESLGDDRVAVLLARGSTMTDDEAVAYARTKLEAVEASRPSKVGRDRDRDSPR
jgi:predicted ATPase/class 3 adenylate cyclase